jgi:hypothetical protein
VLASSQLCHFSGKPRKPTWCCFPVVQLTRSGLRAQVPVFRTYYPSHFSYTQVRMRRMAGPPPRPLHHPMPAKLYRFIVVQAHSCHSVALVQDTCAIGSPPWIGALDPCDWQVGGCRLAGVQAWLPWRWLAPRRGHPRAAIIEQVWMASVDGPCCGWAPAGAICAPDLCPHDGRQGGVDACLRVLVHGQ